jgi:hypothetical protein
MSTGSSSSGRVTYQPVVYSFPSSMRREVLRHIHFCPDLNPKVEHRVLEYSGNAVFVTLEGDHV